MERWISLVMGCVKSVAFVVIINGQSGSKFKPSRGIRQGDPISQNLFLFVSDVFSQMISKAVDSNVLQGINLAIGILQFLTSYLLMIRWCSLKPLSLIVTILSIFLMISVKPLASS